MDKISGRRKSSEDRLSFLPDSILHHILSFLDSRDAVRTSVLSRSWTDVWKHVPALHLSFDIFANYPSFETFVENLLSLRSQNSLSELHYTGPGCSVYLDFRHRVIHYALSHHAQHINITVGHDVYFSELFGSISNHSLKTMKLRFLTFDIGSSCFPMVTTLKLDGCCIIPGQNDCLDLSASFPSLVNLIIKECDFPHILKDTRIKLYAPNLLNLKLRIEDQYPFEFVAPKLEFFRLILDCYVNEVLLKLPFVDHAEITAHYGKSYSSEFDKDCLEKQLRSLFLAVQNVKSLVLYCETSKVMKEICKFLENNPSSFTRLEALACVSKTKAVHYYCLVEGSSSGLPNVKLIRRQ